MPAVILNNVHNFLIQKLSSENTTLQTYAVQNEKLQNEINKVRNLEICCLYEFKKILILNIKNFVPQLKEEKSQGQSQENGDCTPEVNKKLYLKL